MLQTKYLLDHIDALLLLSHDVKDRAVSAKLREMADELRIMVSVADITDLAAALNPNALPSASGSIGPGPVSSRTLRVPRKDTIDQSLRFSRARYPVSNFGMACSKVGAP
jgi:hypothetical protein